MPITVGQDTAKTRRTLSVNGKSISYYSIPAATEAGLGDFSNLPASLKVVLENMLRFEDGGFSVSVDDIKAFAEWGAKGGKNKTGAKGAAGKKGPSAKGSSDKPKPDGAEAATTDPTTESSEEST